MRNMSFSMTTQQMRDETKTVTRRFGWWFLKRGDRVMVVEKAMGLKKGEKIKRLYPIEIISTRSEKLNEITKEDCIKEGFPEYTQGEFVLLIMVKFKCPPDKIVNRIEFKRIQKG